MTYATYPTNANRKIQLASGTKTVSSKHVCGFPDDDEANDWKSKHLEMSIGMPFSIDTFTLY